MNDPLLRLNSLVPFDIICDIIYDNILFMIKYHYLLTQAQFALFTYFQTSSKTFYYLYY